MKRFAKIGVFHHDCWYTKAINKFPVEFKEIGHRTNLINQKCVVRLTARMVTHREKDVLSFIRNDDSVISAKKIDRDLMTVVWKTPGTAFDSIIKSDCPYVSPVYSNQGYEMFDVISDNVNQMKKILNEVEEVGEVKVFYLGDSFNENKNLSTEQLNALIFAANNGYYSWPKKVNLSEVAALYGKSRRAFQENLRKAEEKIMPKVVNELL